MAVKIRLARFGKKNAPIYRIVATDSKVKRNGQYLENLGTYNPIKHQLDGFNQERVNYWVSQGAALTDAVKRLQKTLKKQDSVEA
jgi:small subunit ribosomal protein S16